MDRVNSLKNGQPTKRLFESSPTSFSDTYLKRRHTQEASRQAPPSSISHEGTANKNQEAETMAPKNQSPYSARGTMNTAEVFADRLNNVQATLVSQNLPGLLLEVS
jgi:hypothetical protein